MKVCFNMTFIAGLHAMHLTQILHRLLQRPPGQAALIGAGQRLDAQTLAARVARLAGALRDLGVARGDRVALLGHNAPAYVEALFACWWLGAVACPVNTRLSAAEIVFLLQDCEARLLLVDADHLPLLAALRAADAALCPVAAWGAADGLPDLEALQQACSAPPDDLRVGGDALAALLYTGGTTGRPKGVMLSHANLYAGALTRLADQPSLADSVALLCTPLFHVAAITRVLPHLMAGGSVLLLPQFKAGEVLSLIEQERVTDLPVVPSMLQMLLNHAAFHPDRLRSVRRLSYGAAPASRALVERTLKLLPWTGFAQSYGMTESAAVGTMSRPEDHLPAAWQDGRALSAGRPCASTEVRVVDADGRVLPNGEVGEVLLRGPTVMLGYWRRPQETAQALRDGWLHTGDGGMFDAMGCLHIVDRLKDMIVSGGENVYSAEVENVIALHPAVAQCAVIGVPHAQWGEAVHAVVVLAGGQSLSPADLIEHCRASLAGFKCPKSVAFVAALPLTPLGKVAKNELREPHWRGLSRRVN